MYRRQSWGPNSNVGQKYPFIGLVDQGRQQQACGARKHGAQQKAPAPAYPPEITHPVAPLLIVTAKLSSTYFSFFSSSVGSLLPSVIFLISPSTIRRCQHANRISSFNLSLKCEYFKEKECLVIPWLFFTPCHPPTFWAICSHQSIPFVSLTPSHLPTFWVLLYYYAYLYPLLSKSGNPKLAV